MLGLLSDLPRKNCWTIAEWAGKQGFADGSTKAIDQVRVGDTVANSVPGVAGTEAHEVTAVIVTHTDRDFVDLTIKATAEAGAKQGVKAGAKSLGKKVARKAAFGLAASAAVLGALGASHGHGSAQEPEAKTVAAVSPATPERSAKAVQGGTSDAQGAHLTTTFHHPFYDETQSAFVEGKDLKAGDVLQTPTGTAEVTGVRLYHANTTTYDLTIGTLHTYYVEAGDTPVLVHNCGETLTDEEAALLRPGSEGDGFSTPATRANPTPADTAEMQGHPCHYCGEAESSKSADHHPPAAVGPVNAERCFFPLCTAHNGDQGRAVNKLLQIARNHGLHNPEWEGAWEWMQPLIESHTE